MSYKPTPEELAQAKKVRKEKLADFTAKMKACVCLYPVRMNRNGSGHSDDCPAHLLYKNRHRDLDNG